MRHGLVLIVAMGLLGPACAATHALSSGVASGARTASPSQAVPSAMPNPTDIRLSAPSTDVVWALSGYNRLYRSMDGGARWEQRFVFAGPFRSMSFIDEHEGWVLDSGSTTQCPEGSALLWHTIDAGATWQQLPASGIGASQCKHGMWFFDGQHGIVSASDADHRPTIYRTSDGGRNWAASTLQDPAYFKSRPGGFTLQVDWVKQLGSTLYLEAFGSQDDPNLPHENQFVLKSTDGGASWSLVTKVPSRAVVMVTEARWLDYTAPGQAMESVNGGQQFHQYTSDFNLAASQLVFTDSDIGYAVGSGVIQQTTDGGSHWATLVTPGTGPSPQPPPYVPTPAVQLSVPSANVVWALVAGQYLFRSTDQGDTWETRKTPRAPVGSRPPLISFLDARDGWELVPTSDVGECAQEAAELWQTTDGAATWQLVSQTHPDPSPDGYVPVDQCKDAMYFKDSTHGALAIGDPITDLPAMFRTDNGGVTWHFEGLLHGHRRVVTITALGGTELMEADAVISSRVYIFVNDMFVNGSVVTAPDQAVGNVAFLTPTHWLLVQPGLETTDAGGSWHPFNTDYSGAAGVPSEFLFADDRVGYATVRGDLHRTRDGGAHWVRIQTPGT